MQVEPIDGLMYVQEQQYRVRTNAKTLDLLLKIPRANSVGVGGSCTTSAVLLFVLENRSRR